MSADAEFRTVQGPKSHMNTTNFRQEYGVEYHITSIDTNKFYRGDEI